MKTGNGDVEHAPKRMGLAALASNRLSREGRRRMKRHIDGCDVCRTEWPRVKDALQAVREARGEPPALDWERMEKTLSQVALEESRQLRTIRARERWQKRLGRYAVPIGVVLAAAAAYWLGLRAGRPAETIERPAVAERASRRPPEPQAAPMRPTERPMLTVRSTAIIGRVEQQRGAQTPIVAGMDAPWVEGDAAAVSPESAWEARLCASPADASARGSASPGGGCAAARGGAVRLEAASRLVLTSVRDGWIELTLERGGVVLDAAPITEGERFAVVAGDLAVLVRGTRFRVALPNADDTSTVDVGVVRGVVEVLHVPTGRRNVLEAPARARFVRGAPSDRRAFEGELAAPHGAGLDITRWIAIDVPSVRRGVRSWRFVDGPSGAAAGTLRMREGPAALEWTFADGRVERVEVDLSAGITIEPVEAPATAPRTSQPSGTLPREAIARVVGAGMPAVRRCYEHRLRRRPQLEARVVVRLRIAVDGTVDDARLTSTDTPPELRDCVLPAVRGWRFPSPTGGPVTVQVPLTFARSN